MSDPANRVHEINESDLTPTDQPRQRSARNDPDMRDGDSSHGSPGTEDDPEGTTTDNDVGDTAAAASEEAGVLNAVPGKADGGHADPTLEAAPDPNVGTAADVPDRQVQAGMDANAGADDGMRRGGPERAREFESADRHRRSSAAADAQARGGEPPIEDYKRLTVPQIMERIETMSPEQRRAVQRYEESHRRRKTLLVRLERLLRASRHDARARPDAANESAHGRSMHS